MHLQVPQHFKYRSCFFVILALVLLLDNKIGVQLTICEYDTPPLQSKDESSSSSYYWGGERCGSFQIPFPFCLNTNVTSPCKWSGLLSDAFRLSCLNSTSLFLNIASQSYRVLHFFSDGVLVEFPNTSTCHSYNDLSSFTFVGDEYFAISIDNVVVLYDCQDSSLCRTDCRKISIQGCVDGNAAAGVGRYPTCCYPLSDLSAWRLGESNIGFSAFSQFGCRGFSSWVVLRGSRRSMRGVKLEWAIPRNSTKAVCARYADAINASSIKSGMRCQCRDGFLGDGFAFGLGCFKSCLNNGKEAPDDSCSHNRTISFRKARRTRFFTFHELEEATRGFENGQKLSDGIKAAMYAGVLSDGSRVAVHRIQCESETELTQVLSKIQALSAVSHKNMANLLGWSTDSGYAPLVVYEYPANGTLEEQLFQTRDQNTMGLDWFKRLNIVAETTSFLAFLQCEIYPPIFHCNLQSSRIFLNEEFSVKIAGFGPRIFNLEDDCHPPNKPLPPSDGSYSKMHDVYNLGLILLEVITGTKSTDISTVALQKIRNRKLEEVVDPYLYYHEQPPYRREQIEIVADLATRCLLFGLDGKLGMTDVARELAHIAKESLDGSNRRCPALEETFSNSSLLQMISRSPDSLYAL